MSVLYPTSLDTAKVIGVQTYMDDLTGLDAITVINDISGIEIALETKVGITGSAVTTTHEYKLSGVANGDKAMSLTGNETGTNKTFTNPTTNNGTFNTSTLVSPTANQITFSGSSSGSTILKASAAASGTLTLPAATDTLVGKATTDVLSNKSLADTLTKVVNSADNSAILKFSITGSTGTTGTFTTTFTTNKTLTFPDATDTLVGKATTDTLTNKTLTSPKINENVVLTSTSTELNNLHSQMGAWASWTPSFTNLTVGNGTLVGSFIQLGKFVAFRFKLTFGSTTSITGSVSVTLPATANSNYSTYDEIGKITLFQHAVGTFLASQTYGNGMVVKNATGTYLTNNASITSTVPFTFAATDVMSGVGFYEAA